MSAAETPIAERIRAEPSAPAAIAPSLAIPSPALAEASRSAGSRLGRSEGTQALETAARPPEAARAVKTIVLAGDHARKRGSDREPARELDPDEEPPVWQPVDHKAAIPPPSTGGASRARSSSAAWPVEPVVE